MEAELKRAQGVNALKLKASWIARIPGRSWLERVLSVLGVGINGEGSSVVEVHGLQTQITALSR